MENSVSRTIIYIYIFSEHDVRGQALWKVSIFSTKKVFSVIFDSVLPPIKINLYLLAID